MKDYFITEPMLLRDVLHPYKRLKEEQKILTNSNNLNLLFGLQSSYLESKSNYPKQQELMREYAN